LVSFPAPSRTRIVIAAVAFGCFLSLARTFADSFRASVRVAFAFTAPLTLFSFTARLTPRILSLPTALALPSSLDRIQIRTAFCFRSFCLPLWQVDTTGLVVSDGGCCWAVSLSAIVMVAEDVPPIDATPPFGFESVKVRLSGDSTALSSAIGTVTVLLVSPAAKVSVPLVAV
jgi:hypothetical protein